MQSDTFIKNNTRFNEIKEALWINSDYESKGIKCNPTLSLKIIPDLINDGIVK